MHRAFPLFLILILSHCAWTICILHASFAVKYFVSMFAFLAPSTGSTFAHYLSYLTVYGDSGHTTIHVPLYSYCHPSCLVVGAAFPMLI